MQYGCDALTEQASRISESAFHLLNPNKHVIHHARFQLGASLSQPQSEAISKVVRLQVLLWRKTMQI
jgi:hypothetical protein